MGIKVSPDRAILASVSYLEATAQASWTDVSVFAEVTFPDVLSVEVVTPTDRPYKLLSRPVVDGFYANTDDLVQLFQKAVADVITITEGPEFTYIYGARETDAQEVVDALRYAQDKLLAPETLYLIDNMDGNVEFAMVKVIGELQLLQQNIYNELQKNTADSVETSDFFDKLLIAVRVFSDSITSSDNLEYIDFFKGLFEAPVATETLSFFTNKPLTDVSEPQDRPYLHLLKVVLGSEYDYALPYPEPAYFAQNYVGGTVGEELSTSDFFLSERIYGRFPIDAVNLGDGGTLSLQDYASTTYFAADYVGVGRTL